MEQRSPYFLWIDLEMTGLDPDKDVILEAAAIITDYNLEAKATFHEIVYQPPEVIENMDPWCIKTHAASGLTEKIPDGKPLQQVEHDLLSFLTPYYNTNDAIILCGNTISQDRAFIKNYMPDLYNILHYRVLDVSTLKEIFARIYHKKFTKKEAHRALDDIRESIAELKYYLSFVDLEMIQASTEAP
ncbi:MAG: oligoribonuclease [Deltaproteobacteria bacterium]|nr:oligoribonuclease [Deltaproteobacteria bacterium]